jgi:adenylate cyclase
VASVFLSYSREDAAKARSLAQALEKAGHEVWWDRHINSGSEFSGEIEQALKQADAVLVLWSKAAIASAWVRDEATEGRDSGRLVAVVLDDSRPPMGFRQFQALDLSGWSGRGAPRQFAELVRAIEGKSGDSRPVAAQTSSKPDGRRWARPLLVVAAVAALLLAGAWLIRDWSGRAAAATPTLAVLPFADLSPGRDKAYFSEGVAEEILSVLARDPGIKVIGRSSSRQFQDGDGDLKGIRQSLGVTHVLEGSARTAGDELRMSVRLIDTASGRQLWAEDYQRKMSNIFAVQAEIGRAVAQRLSGSLSRPAEGAGRQSTGVDTYTLYLAARAQMRERTAPSLRQALKMTRQVLASDPNYAPGHAIYAELLWLLSDDNYGNMPIAQVWPVARRHALRAIQLAPGQPEGYAALGTVPPVEQAVAALKKAIQLDPSRSELRLWLAAAYQEMGRNDEALEQHRQAAAMEPIWAPALRNLAQNVAASGKAEEAEALVRQFEARGGAPAQAALTRSQIAWIRGDLSEAIRHTEAVIRIDRNVVSASPVQPFLYHDLGFFERAETLSSDEPRFRLFVTGRYRELADKARAEGLWGRAATFLSMDSLAFFRDWAAIEKFYDQRPKEAADLCSHEDNPMFLIHVATALKARGRSSDAAGLLACAKRTIAIQDGGPTYSSYYPPNFLAALKGQVLALEGNQAAAMQAMNRAFRLGFYTPNDSGLGFAPALDAYRGTPDYAALDAALKRRTASQRADALRQNPGLR